MTTLPVRTAGSLLSVLTALFCLAAVPRASAAAADSRRDMVSVLEAGAPHPSLGEAARVWDRFAGTWDCDFGFHAADGKVTHASGELIVGWILDGLAIQDIWMTYPAPGSGAERTLGTTIRTYDAKAKLWQVVFVAASFGTIITLDGGEEGDRIVLRGKQADGALVRWSFNDIRPDAFVWRGEISSDGGKTWFLQEEHQMRRRGAARG